MFGVVGGGLWTATGSDGKTSVVSGRRDTRSSVLQGRGVISGTPPDGESYRVISGGLDSTVRGVSAGILLDSGQQPARAIGVASFQRGEERPGLPSFVLSAPLRWAADEELPLQMAVQYDEFVVRRGCSTSAKSCSEDRSLQVVAAGDAYSSSVPWPGGDVRTTTD